MYFRSYGLAKGLLYKYLKSTISQESATSNMVKVLKHILNSNDGTFI